MANKIKATSQKEEAWEKGPATPDAPLPLLDLSPTSAAGSPQFEAGRADHAKELESTATKLGRVAGRAFAELKKRANEP